MYSDMNIAPAILSNPLEDRMSSIFAAFRNHHRERMDLMRLSNLEDHLLKDMGLTREQVLRSKPRPFRHFIR